MAIKLTLDGQQIGELNDKGQLVDASGTTVTPQPGEPQPKPDQMRVPLNPEFPQRIPQRQQVADEGGDPEPKPQDGEPEGDDDPYEGLTPQAREALFEKDVQMKRMADKIETLNAAYAQLASSRMQNPEGPQPQIPDTEIDLSNLPDVPDDKDPFGVVRTLKHIASGLNAMNKRVTRLDDLKAIGDENDVLVHDLLFELIPEL